MTEAGDADRIIRSLGGLPGILDKSTTAANKLEEALQKVLSNLSAIPSAATTAAESMGTLGSSVGSGGGATFGGAGATTRASEPTFGGTASAAEGLAANAPAQTQATITTTAAPTPTAPRFTSSTTETTDNSASSSLPVPKSPVSKDVATFGGGGGGGGDDGLGREAIDWGRAGAAAGSTISAAAGLAPSVELGINRKEDSFFASVVSTGGSGFADSNRNTIRDVIGPRMSDANSDMEVLSVAEKTHMGSKTSDQQILAEYAGYSAQMYGVSNKEGAEAAQDIWSPETSNYLLANYGIQTTDATGARRSAEDINREFADTLKAQNPNIDAATLDQFAQSGAMDAVPEALIRGAKDKWAADEMGVEWSMDADSEYVKATGADQTTTSKVMEEHAAQTEYVDTGADSASTGFELATEASTKLAEGLNLVYDAAGPAAEALQQLRGASTQLETDPYGQAKKVADMVLPSEMGTKAVSNFLGTTGHSAGVWDVPQDMTANLHTGELLLPTTIAQTVRSALAGENDGKKDFTEAQFSTQDDPTTTEDDPFTNPEAVYTPEMSASLSADFGVQTVDATGNQRPISDIMSDWNARDLQGGMASSIAGWENSGALEPGWSDNFAPDDAEQSGDTALIEELKNLLGTGDKEGEGGYTLEDFLTESKDVVASQMTAAESLSSAASDLSESATGVSEDSKESVGDALVANAKTRGAQKAPSEGSKAVSKAPVKGEAPKATTIKKQDKLSFAKSSFSVDDKVSFKKISGADMGGANTRLSLGMGEGGSAPATATPGTPAAGGTPATSYDAAGGAEQWRPVVLKVLADLGLDAKYADGILGQINQESSGNPEAVNLTDSNAQSGYPSRGLLQTIPATYNSWAPPGKAVPITQKDGYQYAEGMTDPYNNIYAGVNYASHNYGLWKLDEWNSGVHNPYSEGAWRVPGDQIAKIHDGEMIIPSQIAEKVRTTVRNEVSGMGSQSSGGGIVNVHVTLNNASYSEATRLIQVVKEQIQTVSDDDALVSR